MSEISKNNKEIGKTIATKVPINIHNQLMNLIENGDYLSISDFLREAIREQLKTYKVANFREINYFDAKKEVVSYFIKYDDCFLDEIAIDLELDFELVLNIIKDLMEEGRIVKISNEELFEKRGIDNLDVYRSKDNDSVYKIEGKRFIVESRFKDYEFITIRHNADYKSVFKNNGMVLENASVILSEAYSFIK
ncbi:MAG: ribbon-helix-helix domain-containing protein [Methanobrevibacter ruminantium]|uniref:ribbon-helix-helix domain-containing protein n=1 Tax=Methanobrevibacter ruminantium TaxID=83816 RepID=UPI0026EFEF2B|nr:ribbon-helix-helix domain-containing protein [Methanobrevibacter ruminantium]MCI5736869.1 ribbon-helix-helix domain-containing protein [Methanobrevibacter ruminantium]MDD6049217.1 ribbon-helix-helix domain-containing protein [Methanobrevibacter ruminantium]